LRSLPAKPLIMHENYVHCPSKCRHLEVDYP